jgi:enoyl-CoA hydratase
VRFRQLEIGRGIVPFGAATFRAPARLGWRNAMRFLLTAEEFGASCRKRYLQGRRE